MLSILGAVLIKLANNLILLIKVPEWLKVEKIVLYLSLLNEMQGSRRNRPAPFFRILKVSPLKIFKTKKRT